MTCIPAWLSHGLAIPHLFGTCSYSYCPQAQQRQPIHGALSEPNTRLRDASGQRLERTNSMAGTKHYQTNDWVLLCQITSESKWSCSVS